MSCWTKKIKNIYIIIQVAMDSADLEDLSDSGFIFLDKNPPPKKDVYFLYIIRHIMFGDPIFSDAEIDQ